MEQYGFLIRALSISAYYRYDDGGNLTVNIDNFGNVALSTTTRTLFPVAMPPLTVSFEE